MSTAGPVMNLVRASYLNASFENDYVGAAELSRHDEVLLVDPNGEPCSAPGDIVEDSIDYEFSYVNGDSGRQVRGTQMQVRLPVDYIDGLISRKLDRWKRERASVLVLPNFGRNTLLSWRAIDLSGSSYTDGPLAADMTGQYAMTSSCGTVLRYWNPVMRAFIPKNASSGALVNRTQLIETPGGAGVLTYQTAINRMIPTYPKSATLSSAPTASGWAKGGADAAHITAALVTNGFGQTDCPHSLRVSVNGGASIDRYLVVADQFNPAAGNFAGWTFLNSYPAVATVWVRGQFPDTAYLSFGNATSNGQRYDLGQLRFDGWTPISIACLPTNWDTVMPYLGIGLNSSAAVACEFEIGPTMVQQQSGTSYLSAGNVWTPNVTGGTAAAAAYVATTTALRLPGQGTIMCSFWCPDDIGASWRSSSIYGLCGNGNFGISAQRTSGGSERLFIQSASPSASLVATAATAGAFLRPGKMSTFAITWDSSGIKLYANGALAASGGAGAVPLSGSESAWKIAGSYMGYGSAPIAVASCRIDEGAMTATEIENLHLALTDPGVLNLSVAVSGRTFRIASTPGTVRHAYGDSQVIGDIELTQTGYNHYTADPFYRERSIG